MNSQRAYRHSFDLPFISAGMGFIATPPLVAAVSNARGFGLLASDAGPRQCCEN
jgi:NAD(P)H-dependent flavin oxidoreductase YrpB (nitropropane dioxygenase family)